MRLREWAARWLVGAAAFLYTLFFLSISFPTPFAEVSLAFILQCDFWEAIPLSPFPVVSLRFAVSVLTAPVTHQVLDLQKNQLCSATPVRFADPENLRFQAVSKSCLTGPMVISQPLVAHGVGGQDGDELVRLGWSGCPIRQCGFSPTPRRGSPFQPIPYPNNFSGLNGT